SSQTVPPSKFNYTRTYTPINPGTDTTAFSYSDPFFKTLINTTYTNGFGAVLQTTVKGANDIVTPKDIRLTLTSNSFLPYPVTSGTGFQMQPFQDQRSYYNTAYPGEQNISYSQTIVANDQQVPTIKTFSAGASFAGERRGDSVTTSFNTSADAIIK